MLEVGSRKMESSIEASFYPDESTSYLLKERMRNVRKTLTLDLESPSGGNAKRQKFALLSSPDLNMLKLGSPELENLIIQQQNGHVTTTPTPTQFIFARTVTEEQAMYAEGFVNALRELHSSQQPSSNATGQEQQLMDGDQNQLDAGPSPLQSGTTTVYVTTTSAASPGTYTSSSSPATISSGNPHTHSTVPPYQAPTSCAYSFSPFGGSTGVGNVGGPPRIKEEPQTVPPSACSSPPLSPIDMMAQERIKLERKRQRNRVAASKCRKRKLERIARLEHKVSLLKNENSDLGAVVTKLKDHICGLKQQLMEHVNSGCHILTPSQY